MQWLRLVPAWGWAAGLALVIGIAGGGWINGALWEARLADAQRVHAEVRQRWADQALTAQAEQQRARLNLEGRLAALDETKTKELKNEQDENDRLRREYSAADTERKRLRIEVVVARADAVVSAATGPGSMGDAASVELSDRSGQAVWDIRQGMIDDRAKLEYLQGYVRALAR